MTARHAAPAQPAPGERLVRAGAVLFGAGVLGVLAVVVALPWLVYPPVAMDILAWGLFAISVDLLLGFTGLLSFGHAAFWGASAYATGLVAIHSGLPFPVAVVAGAVVAMLLDVGARRWVAVDMDPGRARDPEPGGVSAAAAAACFAFDLDCEGTG